MFKASIDKFLEIVNVSEPKSIALDVFDQFASRFKLGVRIR
ncbi:transposase [Streptococcus equi subsp. zooepidemicus ATCC 35246]|nr:transposase [Streptococcus equi subsp. zooepidemicus ATCC 35246]AIA68955.1 hypothetical protein Q426_08765 [Streptococcus equi subsp. zooepidemicus CY]